MGRSSLTVPVLLAMICIAIWGPVNCSGNFVLPIPGMNLPGVPIPGMNLPGIPIPGMNLPGLPWGQPCMQVVLGTEGCVEELVSSFLSLQPKFIGPQCCKAAISIEDGCWPKIFPLNPFFPPLLKSFCSIPTSPPMN